MKIGDHVVVVKAYGSEGYVGRRGVISVIREPHDFRGNNGDGWWIPESHLKIDESYRISETLKRYL